MHIENDKLVGSYVSEVIPEHRAITVNIIDGDSTPKREFTQYKYVQTEQLTEIGVAVKPYGSIIIPIGVANAIANDEISGADFGIIVNYNGVNYGISLGELLSMTPDTQIEFIEVEESTYKGATFNAEVPPFNSDNNGSFLTIRNGELVWTNEVPNDYYEIVNESGTYYIVKKGSTDKVKWEDLDATKTLCLAGGYHKELYYPYTVFSNKQIWYISISSGSVYQWIFKAQSDIDYMYRISANTYYLAPDYSSTTDIDKVLKVKTDGTGLEWDSIPNELPAIASGDGGKVLKVNAGETGTEWGSIPSELPTIDSGDAGKVLKVNAGETGTEWGSASTGKYLHNVSIKLNGGTWSINVQYISTNNSKPLATGLVDILTNNKSGNYVPISGYAKDINDNNLPICLFKSRVASQNTNYNVRLTGWKLSLVDNALTFTETEIETSVGYASANEITDIITAI